MLDMQWPEARAAEAKHLQAVVTTWLSSKGVAAIGSQGSYQPEDASSGIFSIQDPVDGARSWWMLQLDEETPEGRRFSRRTCWSISIARRRSVSW